MCSDVFYCIIEYDLYEYNKYLFINQNIRKMTLHILKKYGIRLKKYKFFNKWKHFDKILIDGNICVNYGGNIITNKFKCVNDLYTGFYIYFLDYDNEKFIKMTECGRYCEKFNVKINKQSNCINKIIHYVDISFFDVILKKLNYL